MINLKTLNDYTKFINLKQVCILSDINYNSVKDKVRKFREGKKTKLSVKESQKLTEGFRQIGIKKPRINPKN